MLREGADAASNGTPPSGEGTTPPAPPATPPATPPETPPETAPDDKDNLSFTKQAFNERLERASKTAVSKLLKEHGFKNVDEYKAFIEKGKSLEEAEKERNEANMSEIEKLNSKLAEKDTTLSELQSTTKSLKLQLSIRDGVSKAAVVSAQHKTAQALYMQHLSENPDDAQTPEDFFSSLKENEAMGFLFGDKPGKETTTTQTTNTQTDPGTSTGGEKNANEMTDEEWAAYKQKMGLM